MPRRLLSGLLVAAVLAGMIAWPAPLPVTAADYDPVLLFPINGEVGGAGQPTFTWEMPATFAGTLNSQKIWISEPTDTNFTLADCAPGAPVNGCRVGINLDKALRSYTPPGPNNNPLLYGKQYRWRLNTFTSIGNGQAASTFVTTTAPAAPVLDQPSDGATGVSTRPTLTWQATAYTQGYILQVGTDATFSTNVVINEFVQGTSYSYTQADLALNTIYYWRVQALNGAGSGPWSVVRSFRTVTAQAGMTPPVLVAPAAGATVSETDPVFTWQAVPGATYYILRVSAVAGTSQLVFQKTVPATQTSYQYTTGDGVLTYNRTDPYYWQVEARSSTTQFATSAWQPFTFGLNICPAPLVPPALLAPAANVVIDSLTPTLDWADLGKGASTNTDGAIYKVFVNTANTQFGGTQVYNGKSSNVKIGSGVLQYATDYYWRVEVTCDGTTLSGTSGSQTRKFRTPDAPPGPQAPALLSPANNSATENLTPTLDWTVPFGAAKYEVQLTTVADTGYAAPLVHLTDDAAPSPPATGPAATTSSYTLTSALTMNQQYRWRVRAVAADGTTKGAWSTEFIFGLATLPATPVLSSPADGAVFSSGASLRPTLTWTSSPPSTSYRVQLFAAGGGAQPAAFNASATPDIDAPGQTALSFTPGSDLLANTWYWWRVAGNNAGLDGAFSAPFKFKTAPAPAPNAPVNLAFTQAPAPDTGKATIRPTLSWADGSAGTASQAIDFSIQVTLATDPTYSGTLLVNLDGLTTPSFTFASDLAYNTAYLWRVRGRNNTDFGPWAEGSFTTLPPPPPSQPVLSAPANGTTTVSNTPTFDWDDVTGAAWYQIQFATSPATNADGSFSTSIYSSAAGALTQSAYYYQLGSNITLQPGTTYYWHVRAYNGVNPTPSAWSTTFSFTTPAAGTAVAPASLDVPGVNATGVAIQPSFDWPDAANACAYRLTVRLSNATGDGPQISGPAVFENSSIKPSFFQMTTDLRDPNKALNDPTGVLYNTKLWWRIQSRSGNPTCSSLIDGPATAWQAFTTRLPDPPAQPALTGPANDANTRLAANPPTFTWTDGSAGTPFAATSFRIDISTSADLSNPLTFNATTTSFTPPAALDYDQVYYWAVTPSNAGGNGPRSAIFAFLTPLPAPPTAPALNSPANAATAQSTLPALGWTDGSVNTPSQASKFRLVVSKALAGGQPDTGAANLVLDTGFLATSNFTAGGSPGSFSYTFTTPLAYNTTYYWSVTAQNKGGTGNPAAPFSFTTIAAGPALIAPGTAGAPNPNNPISSVRPEFSWNALAGATEYQIEYAVDSAFTGAASATVTTTTFTPVDNLTASALYGWRVRAKVGGVYTDWSNPAFQFYTPNVTPPAMPALNSPTGGVPVNSLRPTFNYTKPTGATYYDLQVTLDSDPGFASPVYQKLGITTHSSFTIPDTDPALPAGAALLWRLRAGNSEGTSAWPGAAAFVTPAAGPANLTVSGADLSVPTFTWDAAPGNTNYNIVWSTSPTFATGNVSKFSAATSYTVAEADRLAYNTTYYARVKGSTTSTAWSDTISFTTPPAPAAVTAPALLYPGSGATGVEIFPTFQWSRVDSATTYELEIFNNSNTRIQGPYIINQPATGNPSYKLANTSSITNALAFNTTYKWKVTARNPLSSAATALTSFTIRSGAAPGTPLPLAPADQAILTNVQPALTWQDSGDLAATYAIKIMRGTNQTTGVCHPYSVDASGALVNNNTLGTSVFVNTTTRLPTYTFTTTLVVGYCYYWQVQAVNSAGTSGWTTPQKFTIGTASAPANPRQEASPWQLRPKLAWDLVNGATGYKVQISTGAGSDSNFVAGLVHEYAGADGAATTYTPPAELPAGPAYYWRVAARAGATDGPFTAIQTLTPSPLTAPLGPLAPTNVQTTFPSSGTVPAFTWEDPSLTSLDGRAATSFEIEVAADPSTNATTGRFIAQVKATNVLVTALTWNYVGQQLSPNTTYYVHIRGRNNAGNTGGAWTAPIAFQTGAAGIPLPPAPTGPSCATEGLGTDAAPCWVDTLTPTFTWQLSQDATFYRLVLGTTNATDGSFVAQTEFTVPGGAGATSYTLTGSEAVTLTNRGKLRWGVKAGNSAGLSPVGATGVVQAVLFMSGTPGPISPAGNTTVATLRPTFSWSPVQYAQRYRLHLFNVTLNQDHLAPFEINAGAGNDTGTTQAYTLETAKPALNANQQYRWRVLAINERGETAYSAWADFLTPANPQPPAGTVTPASPADGATNQSLTPTFVFSYSGADAATITGYQLQVMKCGAGTTCTDPFTTANGGFIKDITTTATSNVAYLLTGSILSEDTLYTYRVLARNAQGLATPASTSTAALPKFRTGKKKPVLIAPAGTITDDTPTFEWQAVAATSFTLEVSTSQFFSTLHPASRTGLPGDQLSYTATDTLAPGPYYWRVKHVSGGATTTSDTGTFTVALPATAPPQAPANLAPTGPISDTTPALTWTDPGAGTGSAATQFEYIVYDSGNQQVATGLISTNSVTLSTLALGSYTFKVRGRNSFNGGSDGPFSALAAFTITVPPTTPQKPALLTPATNVTGIDPNGLTLTWKDPGSGTSAEATRFRLAVRESTDLFCVEFPSNSVDPACASGGALAGTPDTDGKLKYSYTLTADQAARLKAGTKYNWAVGARNGAVAYWVTSNLFYFTTASGAIPTATPTPTPTPTPTGTPPTATPTPTPGTPTATPTATSTPSTSGPAPLSPAGDEVVATLTPLLTWQTNGASAYDVEVLEVLQWGLSSKWKTPWAGVPGPSVQVDSGKLMAGKRYVWRVKVKGGAVWSDLAYFQTAGGTGTATPTPTATPGTPTATPTPGTPTATPTATATSPSGCVPAPALTAPADGATVANLTPVLQWQAAASYTGGFQIEVWLKSNADVKPVNTSSGFTALGGGAYSYQVGANRLTAGNTYVWRITPKPAWPQTACGSAQAEFTTP
jgi:hypothetical protein